MTSLAFGNWGATIREQTWGDEIANSLSHGLGLLLAIASLPILVEHAASRGSTADIVGASLFDRHGDHPCIDALPRDGSRP